MTELPSVSVIVAAAQASQSLPTCLGAILEQDYEGDIEVIVAATDDGSPTSFRWCSTREASTAGWAFGSLV